MEAITIKLNPTTKRQKGDVRAVVERLRALPELRGASLAGASRDLIVLIPGPTQSIEELKLVLLRQPEVYELEVGEELFRREGDKPYDQLKKKQLAEVLASTKTKIQEQVKDKLRTLLQKTKKKKRAAAGAGSSGGSVPQGSPAGPQGNDEAARQAALRAKKREVRRAARRAKRQAARVQQQGAAEL